MTMYSVSLSRGEYSAAMQAYLESSERGKPFVYLPESDELNSLAACVKGVVVGGGLSLLVKGLTFVTGFCSFGWGAVAYGVHKLFRDRQLNAEYAYTPPRQLSQHAQDLELVRLAQAFQIDIPQEEQNGISSHLVQIDTQAQELENDLKRHCIATNYSYLSSLISGSAPEDAQERINIRLAVLDTEIHALEDTMLRIKAGDKPA